VTKKTSWLRTLVPEEQHRNGFLRFSFCLVYSRLKDEKAGNWKTATNADKLSPSKSLFSPANLTLDVRNGAA
jgi:hypothetical protein